MKHTHAKVIIRVPAFLPRWNSLTLLWLLKWNSRYPVNSKNSLFWKINVIFLLSAPHPYTDSMPSPFFIIFIFTTIIATVNRFLSIEIPTLLSYYVIYIYIIYRILLFISRFFFFSSFSPTPSKILWLFPDFPWPPKFPDSPWLSRLLGTLIMTRSRWAQPKWIRGAGLVRDLGGMAAEIISFEHFLESLKGRWWPDISWQAIPDQGCSGVKCERAKFSFWGWLYEIRTGVNKNNLVLWHGHQVTLYKM